MSDPKHTRLDIYNLLREAHKSVDDAFDMLDASSSNYETNCLDAVIAVLYMAEKEFGRQE